MGETITPLARASAYARISDLHGKGLHVRHPLSLLVGLTLACVVVLAAGASPGPGGWSQLGNGGKPGTASLNGSGYVLNANAGILYAGGAFSSAGGNPKAS